MNWPAQKWWLAPLLPLSWLYRAAVAGRNFFYDNRASAAVRLPAQVISIGNLTAGGSGKTPTTAFLSRALVQRGFRVAIVARGYGRAQRDDCIVSDGHTVLAEIHAAGDEPLLLAQTCPGAVVVVSESKLHAAQLAVARFQPQFILVDDGFQHRRLHRDVDLVLLSAWTILQNSWLLPAGPLREPLQNLKRAHIVLLTETSALSAAQQKNVAETLRRYTTAQVLPLAFEPGEVRSLFDDSSPAFRAEQKAGAILVSGIALPQRFRRTAESAGFRVLEHLQFRDHHDYTERDIAALLTAFQRRGAELVLTTAKDAVKLRSFARLQVLPIYVLELRLADPATVGATLLQTVLASRKNA